VAEKMIGETLVQRSHDSFTSYVSYKNRELITRISWRQGCRPKSY